MIAVDVPLIRCGPPRGRRVSADQRGIALPMVLAFIVVTTFITVAVLAYATTSMQLGKTIVDRNDQIAAERDALEYTLQVVRTDLNGGSVSGTSTITRTVAGISAICSAAPDSGVTATTIIASGPIITGRTDRLVTCTTPSITTEVRFFDRGGSRAGVIEEILRWDVRN